MAAATLLWISGCSLWFSVFFLCPWRKFEEDGKSEINVDVKTQRVPFRTHIMLYLVRGECKMSFPCEGFHVFKLSVCMSQTPSPTHRCGCLCMSTHAHVMLENVSVRWWCDWLPCFYESCELPFADLATADRQKYTQACCISLKAHSRIETAQKYICLVSGNYAANFASAPIPVD